MLGGNRLSFDNEIYLRIFDINTNKILRNQLSLIIESVLAIQADISFGFDFLKLQAIISRTNLLRKSQLYGGKCCEKHRNCDLCNSGHCIDLITHDEMKVLWQDNYEDNLNLIKKAIKETDGLIITYENNLIDARFSYTCGGGTENSENIIHSKVIYLRRVLCNYCQKSPEWKKIKELSIDEIEQKLGIKFPTIDTGKNSSSIKGFIENIERDETGRVSSLKIGGKNFTGLEAVKLLGLESTRFNISPVSIRFITRGKGDGLGLCQWGAKEMLQNGSTIEEVIEYYYTGTKVTKAIKPSIKKPLLNKKIMLDAGHGGHDSEDAIAFNGIREKDLVLYITKILKTMLEDLGVTVYMTREADEFKSLKKRADMCNDIRPDFFISFHMNYFKNKNLHGCEIYHYRDDEESHIIGKIILNKLNETLGIVKRGVKNADFYLLREIGVSSLHIEVEYLSNDKEAIKLSSKKYLEDISKVISDSIIEYFLY